MDPGLVGRRGLAVGRKDVARIRRHRVQHRNRGSGLPEPRASEGRIRSFRLPHRGCDRLNCDCRNPLRPVWNKPRCCAGGPGRNLGHAFPVADFQAIANADAQRQSIARTLAYSQDFTIAANGASGFASPKTSTLANSETNSGEKHLRCARKPVGLQLLQRQPHLQSSVGLLQLLQLHPELLEKHPWVC